MCAVAGPAIVYAVTIRSGSKPYNGPIPPELAKFAEPKLTPEQEQRNAALIRALKFT